MRKIAAIVSVCLVCLTLCLSLPIKGRAMGADNGLKWYSVLQFDYIETAYNSVPCPFNYATQGTNHEPFEFLEYGINGYLNMTSGSTRLNGYLNAMAEPYISFYSALQVVRMNQLKETFSYSVAPGIEGMYFGGAEVSCYVITFDDPVGSSDEVSTPHQAISGYILPSAAGSVDLGSGLYKLLVDNGFGDDSYVLLSELTMKLDFITDTVRTPAISVSAVTNHVDPDLLFAQWVDLQDVIVKHPDEITTEFNLGTWLADSVSGFLKAEIFPGFSIDKIFYIVLVVGVLLWFFKVIS